MRCLESEGPEAKKSNRPHQMSCTKPLSRLSSAFDMDAWLRGLYSHHASAAAGSKRAIDIPSKPAQTYGRLWSERCALLAIFRESTLAKESLTHGPKQGNQPFSSTLA